MSTFTLADLETIIAKRAAVADPASSYTAQLLSEGVQRCAKKFGEEAVEAALAAVGEDRDALTSEAADVIYHLLVMLKAREVAVADVMATLEARTQRSGHAEKASRKG